MLLLLLLLLLSGVWVGVGSGYPRRFFDTPGLIDSGSTRASLSLLIRFPCFMLLVGKVPEGHSFRKALNESFSSEDLR